MVNIRLSYEPLYGKLLGIALHSRIGVLDAKSYGDVAQVKPDLPNGYALFLVEDIAAETRKLEAAEVELFEQSQSDEGDTYCLGLDQDKNIFMLWERNFYNATDFVPTVSGFPQGNDLANAAEEIITAWLTMDTSTLDSWFASSATWFDNTRFKNRGQERDDDITTALSSTYWSVYDQGEEGLTASIKIENYQSFALGSHKIVTYDLYLKGEGAHPFQDSAWVTQMFNDELELIHTFIVDKNHSENPVLELDYTGYPVQDVNVARQFYEDQLGFGQGYPDESYYGFWSNHAVFGLYETEPERIFENTEMRY